MLDQQTKPTEKAVGVQIVKWQKGHKNRMRQNTKVPLLMSEKDKTESTDTWGENYQII